MQEEQAGSGTPREDDVIKIKREEKFREEQDHLSDFRDSVLEVCLEYQAVVTEIKGEKEALSDIQSLVTRRHATLADCIRYVRDELEKIETREGGLFPIKSNFKEEILRAIALADSNYGSNAKQNVRDRVKERSVALSRDSTDSPSLAQKYAGPVSGSGHSGMLADFRNHFKAHLLDYSVDGEDDIALRDFFSSKICDCTTDVPLFLTLYATFSYYLQYQAENLSERENKKNQKKLISGDFVVALIGASIKTFLGQDSAVRDKYTREEASATKRNKLNSKKIPLSLKIKVLKECNEALRKRVGADEQTELGFCIPVMWEALKVSNETWRNERAGRRERILDVLWAYLSRNLGEYVRSVEDLPSDLPVVVKALFANPKYFPEATLLILPSDPAFPPPLRSFEDDIRSGESSIVAAYFNKYSCRVKSGRKYPPFGAFISDLIKLSNIDVEQKIRIIGEFLYYTAEFLLHVNFPAKKFVESALIGCFSRAMRYFPEVIDKARYAAIVLHLEDPDKSFTDTERRSFLGSIMALLEKYAIPHVGVPLLNAVVLDQFRTILHWDVALARREKNLKALFSYIAMFFNDEPGHLPIKKAVFIQECAKCDIMIDLVQIKNFPNIDEEMKREIDAEIQKVRDARSSRTFNRSSVKKLGRSSTGAASTPPVDPHRAALEEAVAGRQSFSSGFL